MIETYTVPEKTKVGHIHLKVSNLEKAIAFYGNVLGFKTTMRYGEQAAFLAAGNYHHHIGLNTWHSQGNHPAPIKAPGLYHTAFLYPTRKDLATILKRLIDVKYPLTGAADHGVSEAIYLDDPDKNGVELYWDKPIKEWPMTESGALDMYTKPLDLDNLLAELNN
ncbi:glyoxalase [Croceivirga radicis]|uniref:Glyoxalase n=1 Tax=Croceivirga radicis TaxID=1929488 RepID=A0A1V6LQ55_9FLAO|nr:VOC family protein [Croceivirga radicis]OQD42321.1 glyoxalase [Croceivirga radicis]